MILRKIQETGGGTYTISLPKKWTEKVKVKQGDYLTILERKDGKLVLSPETHAEKEETASTIYIGKKKPDAVIREVIAAYIYGADNFYIVGENVDWKTRRTLKEKLEKILVGVEIIDEKNSEIAAKCIINDSDIVLDRILKRNYNSFNWMFRDVFSALSNKDETLCDDIIQRDESVDRLTLLAKRQLVHATKNPEFAEKIGIKSMESLHYDTVANSLEGLADACIKIAVETKRLIKENVPASMTEQIMNLKRGVQTVHEESMKAFKKKDITLANKAIEKAVLLYPQCFTYSNKDMLEETTKIRKKTTIMSIQIMLAKFRGILNFSKDISEAVIDLSAEIDN